MLELELLLELEELLLELVLLELELAVGIVNCAQAVSIAPIDWPMV